MAELEMYVLICKVSEYFKKSSGLSRALFPTTFPEISVYRMPAWVLVNCS